MKFYSQSDIKKILEGSTKLRDSDVVAKGRAADWATFHNWIRFIAWTGCRINEAMSLRLSDIDWKHSRVIMTDKKTGKTHGLTFTGDMQPIFNVLMKIVQAAAGDRYRSLLIQNALATGADVAAVSDGIATANATHDYKPVAGGDIIDATFEQLWAKYPDMKLFPYGPKFMFKRLGISCLQLVSATVGFERVGKMR